MDNKQLLERAAKAESLLRELVIGLEITNWSSWQTTAHFYPQLQAAQEFLTEAAAQSQEKAE